MPATIMGSPFSGRNELAGVEHQYDYGGLPDMRPGSSLHEKILKRVVDKATESWNAISHRHADWDKIEDTLKAFIPLDKKEQQVKAADGRKPVRIVVPLTYAVKETILSHLLSIYALDGVWQYEARGPEDVGPCALLENLIDAQSKRFKHLLSLNYFLEDGITKGIGVLAPVWETKYGLRDQILQDPYTGQPIQQKESYVMFEGNRLRNINPRLYLPDPNVAAHEVQDAEYVGWVWRDSQIGILEEEYQNPGELFNAKYLYNISDGRSSLFRGRNETATEQIANSRPVDRIYMYERIVPAELGLGPSEYPEIWMFQVAADRIVISAKPLGLNHNMYPLAVCAPDGDGYESAPIARLEVTMGLQRGADFMFNNHIAAAQKSLNGVTVIDPSVINAEDLNTDKPYKVVRVRRAMFGQNAIEKGFKQFPVPDTTGNNIPEIGIIDGMIAKIAGASDSMQGVFAGGERRSAQEARDTYLSGIGRIEKMARIISEQAMGDLGLMIASHTQQFLSQESYVNITGRYQDELMRIYGLTPADTRIPVGPRDLLNINYDAIIRDGSMPSTSFVQEHIQLMQLAIQDPRVYQTYDTSRWMAEIARSMGIKNIGDFRFKATVAPDAQVMEQADAGALQAI